MAPAASGAQARRCPPRPAPRRPERAPNRRRQEPGRLSVRLLTPGGCTARANAEGRSRRRAPGPAGCARSWGRPHSSAPAGCHWIPGCPPPGPGITWPGLPAAAPDTGSRRKPDAARPRCLRGPPPAAGRRPARLGFPPLAGSVQTGGGWRGPTRPEEGEVPPWPPTGLALVPPEEGAGLPGRGRGCARPRGGSGCTQPKATAPGI